jgi:hypothetical protein
MWVVINILLSWRQRSSLQNASFHCSNCEVCCGFECDTAWSVRNWPTFRSNLLTPIPSEKKKCHVFPKRKHISVRIHSTTFHKAVRFQNLQTVSTVNLVVDACLHDAPQLQKRTISCTGQHYCLYWVGSTFKLPKMRPVSWQRNFLEFLCFFIHIPGQQFGTS